MAKSVKHASTVYMTITKKKGGMLDPGRCRVLFDHRGQIIAKPPQSAGYSTDIAEEDAIEIGMLTKKTHFAFAGPIANTKNAVSSSYAPLVLRLLKSTATSWRYFPTKVSKSMFISLVHTEVTRVTFFMLKSGP